VKLDKLLSINGKRTPDSFHRELGRLMWDSCGMSRNAEGLQGALKRIPEIREEFYRDVRVAGGAAELNQELEKANRISDFLEFASLMCTDALQRDESCGGHFRTEHQTEDGEAKRNDRDFCYSSAWFSTGETDKFELVKEPLTFDNVTLAQRSYK
jgi:succinate dehydrogenase / fumarate reductase flavoprotein subunit